MNYINDFSAIHFWRPFKTWLKFFSRLSPAFFGAQSHKLFNIPLWLSNSTLWSTKSIIDISCISSTAFITMIHIKRCKNMSHIPILYYSINFWDFNQMNRKNNNTRCWTKKNDSSIRFVFREFFAVEHKHTVEWHIISLFYNFNKMNKNPVETMRQFFKQ